MGSGQDSGPGPPEDSQSASAQERAKTGLSELLAAFKALKVSPAFRMQHACTTLVMLVAGGHRIFGAIFSIRIDRCLVYGANETMHVSINQSRLAMPRLSRQAWLQQLFLLQ